ncbi:hypothetical protein D3C87_1856950 [compost metagenome]
MRALSEGGGARPTAWVPNHEVMLGEGTPLKRILLWGPWVAKFWPLTVTEVSSLPVLGVNEAMMGTVKLK